MPSVRRAPQQVEFLCVRNHKGFLLGGLVGLTLCMYSIRVNVCVCVMWALRQSLKLLVAAVLAFRAQETLKTVQCQPIRVYAPQIWLLLAYMYIEPYWPLLTSIFTLPWIGTAADPGNATVE